MSVLLFLSICVCVCEVHGETVKGPQCCVTPRMLGNPRSRWVTFARKKADSGMLMRNQAATVCLGIVCTNNTQGYDSYVHCLLDLLWLLSTTVKYVYRMMVVYDCWQVFSEEEEEEDGKVVKRSERKQPGVYKKCSKWKLQWAPIVQSLLPTKTQWETKHHRTHTDGCKAIALCDVRL